MPTSSLPELIGYLAAALTTAAFLPQAMVIWRTRRAEGVSIGMYGIFSMGVLLWLTYGAMLRAWPVVAANIVTLALNVWILAMKVRFDAANAEGARSEGARGVEAVEQSQPLPVRIRRAA